jgi:SAM-dependent methyltransferase
VIHKNYEKKELLTDIPLWLGEYFKQMQAEYGDMQASVLVSKKGKVTIKTKKTGCKKQAVLEHNRKKKYILEEGKPVPFLVDLGVMSQNGKIIHAKYDKFKQINRYLEFVDDILEQLPKDREVTIVDFGCGKSYLTFALYYFLRELNGYQVSIIGLDLKEDVIDHCNKLSKKYGYQDKLKFYVGDIAGYNALNSVDMVVTLHACDTATDYALAKAVAWGAEVILSVPCCQHEVNKQLHNEMLAPLLKYGLIKERMAALMTDAIRAQLLEEQGYQVQVMEFIDMEHTPKNILIRAVKDKKAGRNQKLDNCMKELHVQPTLSKLLER